MRGREEATGMGQSEEGRSMGFGFHSESYERSVVTEKSPWQGREGQRVQGCSAAVQGRAWAEKGGQQEAGRCCTGFEVLATGVLTSLRRGEGRAQASGSLRRGGVPGGGRSQEVGFIDSWWPGCCQESRLEIKPGCHRWSGI